MDIALVISIVALGVSLLSAGGTIVNAVINARAFRRSGYQPKWSSEVLQDLTLRLTNRTGEDAAGVLVEITGDLRPRNGRPYAGLVHTDGHIDIPLELATEPNGPEARMSHAIEWQREGTNDHYRFEAPGPGKRIKAKNRIPISMHSRP